MRRAMSIQKIVAEREGKLTPALSSTAHRVDTATSRRLFVADKKTKIQYLIDTGADFSVIPPSSKNSQQQSVRSKWYTNRMLRHQNYSNRFRLS